MRTKFRNMVTAFLVMLLASVALFFGTVFHLRSNLANISTNTQITWIKPSNIAKSNSKPKHADIIFYRDNCPHCRTVIPYAYMFNKLTGNNAQYRDLNKPVNSQIARQLNDKSFPDNRMVTVQNGRIYSQSGSVVKTSSAQIMNRVLLFIGMLLIIAFAISFLLF